MYRLLFAVLFLASLNLEAQNIHTIAGTGSSSYNGDSIYATTSNLYIPTGNVAVDASGNVFIPDYGHHRIRKIDASTGLISTVAGTGLPGYNGDNISADTAQLYYPSAVAVDNSGNLYIADYANNRIRKVLASNGMITTIAGNGLYGFNGDSILAVNARITEVMAICLDPSGNVYFSEIGNSRIRKIDVATGLIHTVAGNGVQGYNGDNINAKNAQLNFPHGLTIDALGNLYIGDRENHRIRKVSGGIITTIAGTGAIGFNGDSIPATSAIIYSPWALSMDNSGNLFIADSWTNRIRIINTSGTIYTVAGNGTSAYNGDGGPATSAAINSPRGIFVDACSNLYITDYYSNRIRKVDSYNLNVTTTDAECFGACNGNIMATATGGDSPYTYTITPSITMPPIQNSFCPGSYFVTVTDNNGCKLNRTVTVGQPTALGLTTSSINASCNTNGSASAIATGGTSPYTYSWSSGHTTPTASSLTPGTYTVNATDNKGCSITGMAVVGLNQVTYSSAPICMVTVDSLSQNNVIIWDKTAYTNIDSFIVYREIGTNDYRRLGAVQYNELSQFTDTMRSLYFPNTGNPNGGTYRYKLKMIDTCGNYSQLSPYHNTLFIMNNNGTFSWTVPYTIEGSPNPVNSYVLMRDNNNTGSWNAVNSVAGTQQTITDPAYAAFAGTASWRVETYWNISCTPTRTYTPSRSNRFSNVLISVNDKFKNELSIYPTVSEGSFTIEMNEKNASVQVIDLSGNIVHASSIKGGKNELVLSGVAKGTYLVKITGDGLSQTRRIIIN